MESIELDTIVEEQTSEQKTKIEPTIYAFENLAKAPISPPNTFTSNSLEKEKSISRQQFMLQKKTEIESQLIHYTKVKNRWARADAIVKIVGTSVVFISSILSSIFSAGIAAPLAAATLSGIAALQAGLTEGIMISFTTKRKQLYHKRCDIIREFSKKLYFLYEKCREDGTITLDKMEQFYRLINE